MNRAIKFLALAAVAVSLSNLSYAGISTGRDKFTKDHTVAAEDLSRFHFGIYAGGGTRTMEYNKFDRDIDTSRYVGFLGYDINRYLTAYVSMGSMYTKRELGYGGRKTDSTNSFTYGAGLWARIIDTDQFDFLTTITRFRLMGNVEIFRADFDEYDWTEVAGSLTFELFNEGDVNTFLVPNDYTIFAGPCFSFIESNNLKQSGDDKFGLTAGLSIGFTRNTYFTVSVDYYGDSNYVQGSVGVNF